MAPKAPQDKEVKVEVNIGRQTLTACILGVTPLIQNAMSAKARQGLLLPPRKMNTAEKAANLKHDPLTEYRAAAYKTRDDDTPTRIYVPAVSFKRAIASVATDIPGAAKAAVGRLMWLEGANVHVYGTPQLLMAVVRSADMAKTPDVRSRPILPTWGCRLQITYVTPNLNGTTVGKLLAAAGFMRGVGDWRVEKGSGNFGQFEVVDEADPRFQAVLMQGRVAQDAALANPECYDQETEELLAWYQAEIARRGFKVA